MSSLTKMKMKIQACKKNMLSYLPSKGIYPDAWSSTETGNIKVGDIFVLFQPAAEGVIDNEQTELEVSALALVFREDAFFPMNYLIEETAYEMSFMEGVLSTKAGEARESNLAFYCARSSVLSPLSKDLIKVLSGMEKKYGGSGDRKKDGTADPLHFFLETLGIETPEAMAKEPLPLIELAQALYCPKELPAGSAAPSMFPVYVNFDSASGTATAASNAEPASKESAAAPPVEPAATATPAPAEAPAAAPSAPAAAPSATADAPAAAPAATAAAPAATAAAPAASSADTIFKKEDSDDTWGMLKSPKSNALESLLAPDPVKAEPTAARSSADDLFGSSTDDLFGSKPAKKEETPAPSTPDPAPAATPSAASDPSIQAASTAPAAAEPVVATPPPAEPVAATPPAAAPAAPASLEEMLTGKKTDAAPSSSNPFEATPVVSASSSLEDLLTTKKPEPEPPASKTLEDLLSSNKSEPEPPAASKSALEDLLTSKKSEPAPSASTPLEDLLTSSKSEPAPSASTPLEDLLTSSKSAPEPAPSASTPLEDLLTSSKSEPAPSASTPLEDLLTSSKSEPEPPAPKSSLEDLLTSSKSEPAPSASTPLEDLLTSSKSAPEPAASKSSLEDLLTSKKVEPSASSPSPAVEASKSLEDLLTTGQKAAEAAPITPVAEASATPAEATPPAETASATAPAEAPPVTPSAETPPATPAAEAPPATPVAEAPPATPVAEAPPAEAPPAKEEAPPSTPAADVPPTKEEAPPEPAKKGEPEAAEEQKQRKTMSLQDTLDKLEDQKQKAYDKLEEFRNTHESAYAKGLNDLKENSAKFEQEYNERLKELRKAVLGKLRKLSIEADQKLSSLSEGGRGKLEDAMQPALQDLSTLKDDRAIKASFEQLKETSEQFGTKYKEKLSRATSKSVESLLDEIMAEEQSKLKAWRSESLEKYEVSFELSLKQLEDNQRAALADLDVFSNSMIQEFRRIRDIDVESLSLLKAQLDDSLNKVSKNADMRVEQLCNKATTETIIPGLTELRASMAKNSDMLKQVFVDRLEKRAADSLSDFDKTLTSRKEMLTEMSKDIGDLNSSVEKDGKEKMEKILSSLSDNLDKKLEEFKTSFKHLQDAENEKESLETRLVKRAEQLKQSCLKSIEEAINNFEEQNKNHANDALSTCQIKVGESCSASVTELQDEVKAYRERRQQGIKKLEEKLEKLTASAEAVAANFLQ